VQNSELDDFILLRSDGTPTYMLAVVVDDHDMGVTHVIRGDDHLNNAFRQLAIIRAMGWPEPVYAHVPMIHGHDGGKLSKRHGATGVDAYRDELGMLPEAMFNYLLRLGWGHGDDEIIAREQACRVVRSRSRRPLAVAFRHQKARKPECPTTFARPMMPASLCLPGLAWRRRSATASPRTTLDLLQRAMPELKPRAKTMIELAEGAAFLFKRVPLDMDERAQSLLEGTASDLLARVHKALESLKEWTAESIEGAVRKVSEDAGVKLGQVAQPLRAALTGRATSPGIFDVLVLLGREESLARVADRATTGVINGGRDGEHEYRGQAGGLPGAAWHGRAVGDRLSASSMARPACSPSIRASPPPRAAIPRSPISTVMKGILLYRGYPIDQLAEHSSFMETCYLLLPWRTSAEGAARQVHYTITRHTMLHEQLPTFYRGFRRDAHPMAIMCGVVGALSAFYHDSTDITDPHQRMVASHRLIAKMPTIAAMAINMPLVSRSCIRAMNSATRATSSA
jgi:hypothetical protein